MTHQEQGDKSSRRVDRNRSLLELKMETASEYANDISLALRPVSQEGVAVLVFLHIAVSQQLATESQPTETNEEGCIRVTNCEERTRVKRDGVMIQIPKQRKRSWADLRRDALGAKKRDGYTYSSQVVKLEKNSPPNLSLHL